MNNLITRFNNLKISVRFLVIGVCILPFLIGLTSAGVWGILQVNSNVQDINSDQLFSIYTLGKVVQSVEKVRGDYRQMLLENTPDKIQADITVLKTDLAQNDQYWKDYTKLSPTDFEKPLWNQYDTAWLGWNTTIDQLIQLAQTGTIAARVQAVQVVLPRASTQADTLAAVTSKLLDLNYQEGLSVAADTQDETNLTLIIIIVSAVGITIIITIAGLILAGSMIGMTKRLYKLNSELGEELNNAENKRRFGEITSSRLKSMTSELSATAYQQASRSQEQAAAVQQVVVSISQLGETANHVANNTTLVTEAFDQTLALAQEVEAKSEYLNQLTARGMEAVSSVTRAIEMVGERIEQLTQRLFNLTENSKEIGSIIDTMREIADQTHLLALNAAIESSDSGASSSRRFGVIANEVKSLADRSLFAAKEVQKVIEKTQDSINAAGLVAQEGKQKTLQTVQQARISGEVIADLGQAAANSGQSANRIVEKVSEVGTFAYEIHLATQQQNNAVKQVRIMMDTIESAARENASATSQVKAAVVEIDTVSEQLKQTLDSQKTPIEMA